MKTPDRFFESLGHMTPLMDTIRDPLLVLNSELKVFKASRSFYATFKVTPEETVGQRIYDLGNKQWDIPLLRELLETILPEKIAFDDYEVEHEFSIIGRRVMLLNARQIIKGLGQEKIILLAIEDITERRQLEDLLSESEIRYRRLFETASDGIVLLEKGEGRIVHANPAVEDMLGYAKEEYVGKMLQEIGVPLAMHDFPAVLQDLAKSGILNFDDVTVTTKSGQNVTTDIYMVDRAKLAQCNIRDVSERKLAATTLEEEKSFIEDALNTLIDIFFVFDLEGKFLRWNKAFNTATGYLDPEIVLMQPRDFFRNDDSLRIDEAIKATVKEGNSSFEASLVTKDGRRISYEFSAALLRDSRGKPLGISGVGRDISERQKLEGQFRQSQKMEAVGLLAGGVAHDFNNMLSVINGYAELALDGLNPNDPLYKDIQQILHAGKRSADLTQQLLAFARKQAISPKVLNLNNILASIQKMLERLIREDIELEILPGPDLWNVKMDLSQVDQILANLAVNARDAISGAGKITVETANIVLDEDYCRLHRGFVPGEFVLLSFSDNGHGMSKEVQEHIFEPFYTTKGEGKGTGLGLSTVFGIVKQSKGFIAVYSEPQEGTTFRIYLPRVTGVGEENTLSSDMKTFNGVETLLIVEDEKLILDLAEKILKGLGYIILTASNPGEACLLVEKYDKEIHLLLTDVVMPSMNGKELKKRIEAMQPGIKTVFMSGYTSSVITCRGVLDKGVHFIQKPFSRESLARKIREVLDGPAHS
jgi:PAS domain S-box-containing protein